MLARALAGSGERTADLGENALLSAKLDPEARVHGSSQPHVWHRQTTQRILRAWALMLGEFKTSYRLLKIARSFRSSARARFYPLVRARSL